MLKVIQFFVLLSVSSQTIALELNSAELEYFKQFFNGIQPQSFANNREYCGYIGYNDEAQFVATPPKKGKPDSCLPEEPPLDFDLIGSYHTPGAFSVDADSELPSYEDMLADIAEDIDGFIATPGGRIWQTDTLDGIARMVCDRNCVLADPDFIEDIQYRVDKTYTLQQLMNRDKIDN
ncbi:MAG: hypothetical protein OFPII_22190 [Osedax symbiont Rs1]|nr:MAG: hypothetical protein OFPII_22190 [Osedax symbiont Rs1]